MTEARVIRRKRYNESDFYTAEVSQVTIKRDALDPQAQWVETERKPLGWFAYSVRR